MLWSCVGSLEVAGLEGFGYGLVLEGFLVLGGADDLASISLEWLTCSFRFLACFVELVNALLTTP